MSGTDSLGLVPAVGKAFVLLLLMAPQAGFCVFLFLPYFATAKPLPFSQIILWIALKGHNFLHGL